MVGWVTRLRWRFGWWTEEEREMAYVWLAQKEIDAEGCGPVFASIAYD